MWRASSTKGQKRANNWTFLIYLYKHGTRAKRTNLLIKAKRSQKLVNTKKKRGKGQGWSFGVPNHYFYQTMLLAWWNPDLLNFFSKTKLKAVSVTMHVLSRSGYPAVLGWSGCIFMAARHYRRVSSIKSRCGFSFTKINEHRGLRIFFWCHKKCWSDADRRK